MKKPIIIFLLFLQLFVITNCVKLDRVVDCDFTVIDRWDTLVNYDQITQEDYDAAYSLLTESQILLHSSTTNENAIKAIELISEAIDFDPYNESLYMQRISQHMLNGDFSNAYVDLATVNLLDPQNQPFHFAAFSNQAENVKNLEYCLLDAIKITPDDPYVLTEMGIFYFSIGEFVKAKKYLDESSLLSNTPPVTYFLLANLHYEFDDIDKALVYMKKALEISNPNPFYYEFSARLHQAIGNTAAARNDYSMMLESCNHPDICLLARYELSQ